MVIGSKPTPVISPNFPQIALEGRWSGLASAEPRRLDPERAQMSKPIEFRMPKLRHRNAEAVLKPPRHQVAMAVELAGLDMGGTLKAQGLTSRKKSCLV
jgi:hypothetical protein